MFKLKKDLFKNVFEFELIVEFVRFSYAGTLLLPVIIGINRPDYRIQNKMKNNFKFFNILLFKSKHKNR